MIELPPIKIARGEPFAYDVTVSGQSWVGYSGLASFKARPLQRRASFRRDDDYFANAPIIEVDAIGNSAGLIQISLTAEQTALLPSVARIGYFPTTLFEIVMTGPDVKRFQGYVSVAESISTSGNVGGAATLPGPALLTSPSIIGDGHVDSEHVATNGTWVDAVSYTYRWLNGATPIPGAEASSYTPTSEMTLTAQVRATDSEGETSEWTSSASVAITYPVPTIVTDPVISPGDTQPGQVLTAVNFTFTGNAPFSYDYIWQRSLETISGETGLTYTAQAADATNQIRVGVQATDGAGRVSGYIYSEPVSIDYTGLAYSAQPTFDDTGYVQGETVTIYIGAGGPSATISILEFALDGVDKRGELVAATSTTYTWDSTGEAPGALTYQTQLDNSSQQVQSTRLTVALAQVSLSVPDALDDGFWSVVNEGTGGKLIFTVNTAPANGGTAIIRYEYRQNAGSAVSLGIFEPGSVTVSGFTNGVAADYEIRAVNSSGNGAWNATPKSATASDIVAPETVTAIYDTPTNALTATHSEDAKTWYLVNTSATPLTGAAIKAAVIATTPLVYGSINIGTAEVTPNMGALSTGTYYLHLACEDASVNVEAIGEVVEFDWTGAADTTDPVLSLPTDAAVGTSGYTGTVTTDEGNGTLFHVVSTSATAPTTTQIAAGQMHTGAAAAASGSQAVTATGVQNVSGSGLTAATTYYIHYFQRDAASNDSTVSSGNGFTTAAATGAVDYVSSTLMISTTASGTTFASAADHTVSSQSNRVVDLEIRGLSDVAGAPSITSCTFGGVTGEVIVAPVGPASSRAWGAIYRFVNPTTGARSCALTVTTTQRAMSVRAVEYKSVDQLDHNVASGSSTNADAFGVTVNFSRTTTNDGNMLSSALCIDSGNLAAEIAIAGGATLVAAEQTGALASSDLTAASAYEAAPTAGSNGHAYNWATSKRCVLLWSEIKAA